jgi:hypothetical protein
MTSPRTYRVRRAFARPLPSRLHAHGPLGVLSAFLALAVVTGAVLAFPPAPSARAMLEKYVAANAQSLSVAADARAATVVRDEFSATPGFATISAGGTNHDWAKLVLLYAGWPVSDSNVTVFTRWMRQENGTDDWWNRNNPLNNGWGSGGGGGTGTYASLDDAARNAAEALHENPGYAGIAATFASSAPTDVVEQAIWASPWATGHYANGAHWSAKDVPVVKSPEGTW